MTRVKICGLKRDRDIDNANELLPDYVGFVFVPGSRRYVSPETANRLRVRLDGRIPAVGVFVNEPEEHVARLAKDGIIQMIQLHGSEDDEYIRRLRGLTSAPIIQAFSVSSPGDAELAAASRADFVLLDHGAGGTGEAFDWSLLSSLERPFFLAGGLTPENVAEAIRRLRPMAVDTSSGVETDGLKDFEKMKRFIETVRSMEPWYSF
ncbi:MAG: phosphoribosylanthranilate isomerase [Lawsonibacter sp.]